MKIRHKKLKNVKLFLIIVFFLATTFLAGGEIFAQGQRLEFPIPQPGGQTLGQADLPQYIGGIFTFGLMVVGITAMASILLGGIRYIASDLITTKQDAKDQITSAIYGLLLLLFSYLILNTINPELVSLRTAEMEPIRTATTTAPTTLPPGTLSDAEARRILNEQSGGRITINAPQPQTSLQGIRQSTIQGILSIYGACQCNMVVTGGTEPGHAPGTYSHANGYKIDLRPNTELNQTIYNRIASSCATPPPANTNCAGMDGNVYRWEISHWDICFQCR